MKPHFVRLALGLLLALLFAGCSTIPSRIEEKSAAFAAADPAMQEKVRKGAVEIGYPADLVYIALGKPDDQINTITKHGEDETWIYHSYHQDYAGTVRTGYRRYVVIDPRSGLPVVYLEPVYTDLYREHTEERIRIIFKSGKVEAIEEVKR